jgi:hypothetical protein
MAAAPLNPTTMMPLPRPVSASAVLPSSSPAAPGTLIPNSDECCTVAGAASARVRAAFEASGSSSTPGCLRPRGAAQATQTKRWQFLHHAWGLHATLPGAACVRRRLPGPARARHAPGGRRCAARRCRRPASHEARQSPCRGAACSACPANRAGAAHSASRCAAAAPAASWPRASPSRAAPAVAGAVHRQTPLPSHSAQAAAPSPRRRAPAPSRRGAACARRRARSVSRVQVDPFRWLPQSWQHPGELAA